MSRLRWVFLNPPGVLLLALSAGDLIGWVAR